LQKKPLFKVIDLILYLLLVRVLAEFLFGFVLV